MSQEPDIQPIPSELLPEDKRFKQLPHHKILFPPPFTSVVIGAIGSGKSSFGFSILDKHYKNYFDEVVVLSGTIDSKASWEKLHQRKVVFLNGLDEHAFTDYIKQLEKDQEERKEKGKFPVRVCLVMDDIIFEGFNKNRAGMLEKLMMTCRHYFISIILMLQHSKQISPAMRNQIMYWVLFRMTANDVEKIATEHSNFLTTDQFKDMYHNVMKKGKHEFMIIDYKAPMEDRFRHRFTKILHPIENETDGSSTGNESSDKLTR